MGRGGTERANTPGGGGYWLVAPDGGVFNYGDAGLYSSLGNDPSAPPTTGIIANPDGKGYKLIGTNGAAASFGTDRCGGSLRHGTNREGGDVGLPASKPPAGTIMGASWPSPVPLCAGRRSPPPLSSPSP
jgi:hypothetical protein